jgi:hypothetical protein
MDDGALDNPHRRPTRRLKVDLVELAAAFDNASWEISCFLDLQTGRVILITAETRGQYDELVASIGDVGQTEWRAAFEAVLRDWDIPDWQQESVRDADLVETGFGKRFIRVPQADSREGYEDMETFIETVTNERLAERLARAIRGRGAFRYFKDVLLDFPKERERWFAFRDARQRERVLEWLESEGFEPITGEGE